MLPDIYKYILVMAVVTYLVRFLPLNFLRCELKSPFLKSFLYYTPYVTLTAMIFPGILSSTLSYASAMAALIVACVVAWYNLGLFAVALSASAAVFLVELFI